MSIVVLRLYNEKYQTSALRRMHDTSSFGFSQWGWVGKRDKKTNPLYSHPMDRIQGVVVSTLIVRLVYKCSTPAIEPVVWSAPVVISRLRRSSRGRAGRGRRGCKQKSCSWYRVNSLVCLLFRNGISNL